MLAKFDWEYHGTLSNIKSSNGKGVYLLVFKGSPNRIIYVGTTNCFNRRLTQHQEGMLKGQRTIWRVGENEDIYELMSYRGESGFKGMYKYYYRLSKKGKLWATTTLEKDEIKNDLKKSDDFNNNWKEYVEDFFINRIEIWTCNMCGSEDKIIQLESQIQRSFKKNFFIGSHIHQKGMCWLGKIEYLGEIFDYQFRFKRYPNLDDSSLKLLKNLTERKVISYQKFKYKIKEEEKKEKIRILKETYIYAGDRWDPKELDIIYTCCKLGVPVEVIAVEYLKRSPEEVKKKIEYLGRYYDMSQRS